jgi:hypothetical protein
MFRAGRAGVAQDPLQDLIGIPKTHLSIHPSIIHPSIHPPREEGRVPTSLQHGIQTLTFARSLARFLSLLRRRSRSRFALTTTHAHHHLQTQHNTTERTQTGARQTDRDGRKKARVRKEGEKRTGRRRRKGAIIMATANSNLPRRIIKVRITKNVCFLYLGLISPLVVIEQP